jgi:hypothetical protein
MKFANKTVLITGGTGNMIVPARDQDKFDAGRRALPPGLHTFTTDVSDPSVNALLQSYRSTVLALESPRGAELKATALTTFRDDCESGPWLTQTNT